MTLAALNTSDLLSTQIWSETRNKNWGEFRLVEVDRSNVVDVVRLDDSYEADGVYSTGEMRELCPYCKVTHLKLVLRQKRVRHAHLFCENCDKCFDARNPDGSSALELDD